MTNSDTTIVGIVLPIMVKSKQFIVLINVTYTDDTFVTLNMFTLVH